MTAPAPDRNIDDLLNLLVLATGANEAALWIPVDDGGAFRMAVNPIRIAEGLGMPELLVRRGLVPEVFRTGRLIEDTGPFANEFSSAELDVSLKQRTIAQIGAPVFRFGGIAGVLTIIQLVDHDTEPLEWGFREGSNEMVELAATVAGELWSDKPCA